MATDFVSPVGRLVQGSILEAQTKDNKGAPLVVKTGPNKGQPTQRFFIAIAIRKDDPAWGAFYGTIYNEGRQGYPQLFDAATGACKHPRFAFKIMDGDGTDENGVSNAGKQGFAGHWVVKFSSSFAPKLLHNGQYITDPNYVKRGYFVRVAGNVAPNIGSDVPGVYVNHNAVEFVAYGEEIVSGPNAVALFAAAGPALALPPGATLTPPTPPMNGLAPQMPPAMPPVMPAPAAFTPPPVMPAPAAPVAAFTPPPNPGFVAAALAPAPAGGPPPFVPPVPAAPVFRMTPAAQGYTREQWLAQGYTDDILIAQGIMTRG